MNAHLNDHFFNIVLSLSLKLDICIMYGYYYFDIKLVHAFIFVIPCVLASLFKIWTKLVAKSQAEIISRQLNEELIKMV
jgi:hypothetical protein